MTGHQKDDDTRESAYDNPTDIEKEEESEQCPLKWCAKPSQRNCSGTGRIRESKKKSSRKTSSSKAKKRKTTTSRSKSKVKRRRKASKTKSQTRKRSSKSGGRKDKSKSSCCRPNSNDRFSALKGRKRKPCRPPGPFADYLRDYWKAKKAQDKNYHRSIGEAAKSAAKCWRKLTDRQRMYYRKRYCGNYQTMKKSGTFCGRRYSRRNSRAQSTRSRR